MKKIIKSIEKCLSLSQWHFSTCKAFFTYLRELIEHEGQKHSYPTINLYSTWIVHPEIDRSPEGFELLKRLTESICDHNSNPKSVEDGDIHKRIINSSHIILLRDEVRDLLCSNGLSTHITSDYGVWKGILGQLLDDLAGKTIKMAGMSKKKKQEIQDIAQNRGQPEWAVTGFGFFADGTSPMWEIFTNDPKMEFIRLIGPVTLPKDNA